MRILLGEFIVMIMLCGVFPIIQHMVISLEP